MDSKLCENNQNVLGVFLFVFLNLMDEWAGWEGGGVGAKISLICPLLLNYNNSLVLFQCIEILACPAIIDYLKAISMKELNNNCWFLKFEIHAIFQLIQLSSFMVSKFQFRRLKLKLHFITITSIKITVTITVTAIIILCC